MFWTFHKLYIYYMKLLRFKWSFIDLKNKNTWVTWVFNNTILFHFLKENTFCISKMYYLGIYKLFLSIKQVLIIPYIASWKKVWGKRVKWHNFLNLFTRWFSINKIIFFEKKAFTQFFSDKFDIFNLIKRVLFSEVVNVSVFAKMAFCINECGTFINCY